MNIPDKAVEAAAEALSESIGNAVGIWEMHSWATQDAYLKHARAALEAAAPHMMAGPGVSDARKAPAVISVPRSAVTNLYRTTK